MTMKVRPPRLLVAAVLLGASLLHSSTSIASDSVRPGRNLSLRVLNSIAWPADGSLQATHTSNVWAQRAGSADAVRVAQGLVADGAESVPSSGRVVVVRVQVGRGEARAWLTNAATPQQLLRAMGVRLADTDEVKPYLTAPIDHSTLVRVIRVRLSYRTETVIVPFKTLIQYSKELAAGEIAVLTPGVDGTSVRAYRLMVRNGRVVSRVLVGRRTVTPVVNQLEQHGTGTMPAGGEQCGIASWYNRSTSGAAHKTLPFGTVVTVTNLDNGETVTVTIDDRGPFVAGRIIDLTPDNFAQIAPLGQGLADVCITW
jgi:rare lipoprotein A (RlpA)-like double-psi beta-barrel protein/surface rod structure-forming protein G